MKAAENISLHRTVGDTDPLLMRLLRRTDTSDSDPVPDAATVVMHLALSPVVSLTGSSDDTDSGRFSFPTAAIVAVEDAEIAYEVQVTHGGVEYTVASGTIVQRQQIA